MEARIIQIGNSKGIRLPNALLKQYHFEQEIELTATPEGILIQPLRKKARAGWAEQIKAEIAVSGIPGVDADWNNVPTDWDQNEWTW